MIQKRTSDRIEQLNTPQSTLFDLSEGGACCLSAKKREHAEQINVIFGELSLSARVIFCTERTDGYRMGVQFYNLSDDNTKQLKQLLERFSRGVPLSCKIEEHRE